VRLFSLNNRASGIVFRFFEKLDIFGLLGASDGLKRICWYVCLPLSTDFAGLTIFIFMESSRNVLTLLPFNQSSGVFSLDG
jgi:hypothetical protein